MSASVRLVLQAVALAASFSVSSLYAADLQSLINAHISYVNGGIGQEEVEALRAEARVYPLELTFSRRGDGERAEFVADVHLQILDVAGQVVVDRASQGPIFLAHLPDGQYIVSAEYQGRTQTRRVAVSGARHEALSFHWS
ncbi:MAG TPA: carboxypeptidase regulatory-like domain-containing protein [Casimicrobiaceae bacterium]|nr:carboxypeptidase regulatory-like domain-containing protein [Casimicrobiaceae bacterium]